MKDCIYYLKMDYSLKCFDNDYKKYVIVVYVGLVYFVLFFLFIVVLFYLFYYCLWIKNRVVNFDLKWYEIVEGMCFIYENYDKWCWYWEIVEMVCKLIFIFGLVLFGVEGWIYIGMVVMVLGFYVVVYV